MRALYRLAWPVFITQISIVLNGLIDTLMAGRLSALDLAAVGIGFSVFATIFVTLAGVLLALTPSVAHLFGAGRHEEIGAEVRQAAWLGLALLVVVEVLLLFPDPLLAISRLSPAMDAKVRLYLLAMAWSAPASMAMRVFTGFSSGIGRPRPVMLLSLAGLLLKAPLNWVFMFGHVGFAPQGAAGCGTATAVIMWLSVLTAWYWCWRWPAYRVYQVFARWDWPLAAPLKELLKLGLPIGATFLVDVTAFTFMALFIARLGPAASAAHQIAANLAVLCFMVPTAVGQAGGILSGQALGAGKPQEALRAGLRAWVLGLACTLCLSLLLWLAHDRLPVEYTADSSVQGVAAHLILLVAAYHLADGVQTLAVNLLRGYKKASVPMAVYVLAQWGIGLPLGIWLGLGSFGGAPRAEAMGPAGFWLGNTLALAAAGLAVAVYWLAVARGRVREFVIAAPAREC